MSSTRSSDQVSLSNGIEDIEGGKNQTKASIKSHYGPVWWGHGSAGHLMATTIGQGCPSWRPVGALQAHQPTWPWAKPEFICVSLKRTDDVARWSRITRSIMVIIMPFIKIGQLSQHLASIGGSSARVLAVSRTLHIFHSVLSRPAVSDLTKLNRRWFGPIMFRRAQAKGICWLPLCLSNSSPWFFYPCGSRRGNGAVRLSAVTAYRSRERWRAQRVVSHEPARSRTGRLDRSQGWHKELCHILCFIGGLKYSSRWNQVMN